MQKTNSFKENTNDKPNDNKIKEMNHNYFMDKMSTYGNKTSIADFSETTGTLIANFTDSDSEYLFYYLIVNLFDLKV